jgi:drug/metabolite transporter (DMT)-like permease
MPAADKPIPYGSVAEPLAIASMLVGSTLWGLYWLPLRLLEQAGLAGLWAIMLVYTGATALLLVLALKELPALRRFIAPMLGIGVTAAVSGIAFSLGVIEGEVARVLILFYLSPVWSVVLARLVLREPLAAVTIPAVALALAGASMMLLSGTGEALSGFGPADLLGLLAGFAFALTNVQLRAARDLPARLKNLAASYLVPPLAASVALVAGVPMTASLPVVLSSLAIGALWMSTMIAAVQYGVSYLPLQRSSVLLLFELIVGALSAALIAGEALGSWELAGGACIVVAGLAVVWVRSRAD